MICDHYLSLFVPLERFVCHEKVASNWFCVYGHL